MSRIFIALTPDGNFNKEIINLKHSLKKELIKGAEIAWSDDKHHHITINFNGYMEPEQIEEMYTKFEEIEIMGGVLNLEITGISYFPNENGQVMAYTDKMGYFKMGPKTLVVPGQTSLHQNYPNPFNPSTTIEYDLGFIDGPNQRVNITVYDILGRNIKTLINEQQSIGRYRVKWNGKDQNDVPVSSGIYFVNLMTDSGRTETKKIMLMR